MMAYADTGILCSLYSPDAHSHRVLKRMKTQALPLPITWLHQVELRNALRLRVFRGDITPAQRDASFQAVLVDLADGLLERVTPSLNEMLGEGERLSTLHTEALGTRSLDILHVAAAMTLGQTEFLTLDHRQMALAEVAGLKVPAW